MPESEPSFRQSAQHTLARTSMSVYVLGGCVELPSE